MMPAVPPRVDLVTPAEPARATPATMRKRPGAAVKAAAFGLVGALITPLPAAAAPAPCEQAERYAAQSGAELIRLDKLHLGSAGRDRPVTDIGVGDAKSALVAQSTVSAAAVGRVLDRGPANRKALTGTLTQQAPPSNKKPNRRAIEATEAGPFSLGAGKLTAHAQWEPGMACGAAVGNASRAELEFSRAGILEDGDGALVGVPGKVSSLSTTALERHGKAARTIAAASVAGGAVELLDGAVKIEIVKPPTLRASMSTKGGGEIRYVPAVLQVSGDGFETARLDTAGDDVELALADKTRQTGEGRTESDLRPGQRDGLRPGQLDGLRPGQLDGLRKLGTLVPTPPLPLPSVPGLPAINEPDTEIAPAAGPGTKIRISLGDVRQATSGHAIAAKATAISIAIIRGPGRHPYGHSADNRSGVVLSFDIGLLEVAAVAPEPRTGGASSVVGSEGGGTVGGLPITGPRVDVIALTGVALLLAGTLALALGMRGRSRP
jgi:hypothetical protein